MEKAKILLGLYIILGCTIGAMVMLVLIPKLLLLEIPMGLSFWYETKNAITEEELVGDDALIVGERKLKN